MTRNRANYDRSRFGTELEAANDARHYKDPGDLVYLCRDRRGHFWATEVDTWLLKQARRYKLVQIPTPESHTEAMRAPYVREGWVV